MVHMAWLPESIARAIARRISEGLHICGINTFEAGEDDREGRFYMLVCTN